MRFPSFPAGATVLLVASFIAGCGGSDDNNDASPDAGDSASVDGALPVGSAPSTDLDGVEKIGIGMGDMDPTTTAVISDDEGAPVDTSTAAVSSRLSALEEQQGDLFEEFQYKTQDLNDAMAAHIAEVGHHWPRLRRGWKKRKPASTRPMKAWKRWTKKSPPWPLRKRASPWLAPQPGGTSLPHRFC